MIVCSIRVAGCSQDSIHRHFVPGIVDLPFGVYDPWRSSTFAPGSPRQLAQPCLIGIGAGSLPRPTIGLARRPGTPRLCLLGPRLDSWAPTVVVPLARRAVRLHGARPRCPSLARLMTLGTAAANYLRAAPAQDPVVMARLPLQPLVGGPLVVRPFRRLRPRPARSKPRPRPRMSSGPMAR